MRCYICDKVLSEPNYNSEVEGYEPCDECLAVIKDTVDGYKDNAIVEEDTWQEPSADLGHGPEEEEEEDE